MNNQNNLQDSDLQDSDLQDSVAQYDAHIIPAETAARKLREGESFGHIAHEAADDESIRTTDGYTVDREGLANNYAIEPEMYIDVPGDLREKTQQEVSDRAYQSHQERVHQRELLAEEEEKKKKKE